MPGYYHAPLHDDVVGLEEPLAPPPILLCIGVVRPLTCERIKIGKTFGLGTRLLPDQGGKCLSFLAKCLFLLVGLRIAGMENHVVVMILVNGHIPLKMHFPVFWEAFHLDVTGNIAAYPLDAWLRVDDWGRFLRPGRRKDFMT